jgi:hypothetical protein
MLAGHFRWVIVPKPQFVDGTDRGWIHRSQLRAELVAADRNW